MTGTLQITIKFDNQSTSSGLNMMNSTLIPSMKNKDYLFEINLNKTTPNENQFNLTNFPNDTTSLMIKA